MTLAKQKGGLIFENFQRISYMDMEDGRKVRFDNEVEETILTGQWSFLRYEWFICVFW